MRVLFYNWVDYLDDEKRGGGVSVYQRSLIGALTARGAAECVFLSSGISYDLWPRAPRWERVRHGPRQDRDRRYEIVNSGALSPSHFSFGNAAQIDHPATEAAFVDFVASTGPYDVVHFNNLEGIPARVLARLRSRFPAMRVILSLHNYYPICPQVNLWHQEQETCTDFRGGRKCGHCLAFKPDERLLRLANAVAFRLKKAGIRPGTRAFDLGFRNAMRAGRRAVRALARLRRGRREPAVAGPVALIGARGAGFSDRRAAMLGLVNGACDTVLCVSARVAHVAARFGIEPARLRTSYIGTSEAEKFAETLPRAAPAAADGTLTLAYLGYMRRDKGFFFLLDALEALPEALARRIRLVVGARRGEPLAMARLGALADRLAGVLHSDGYRHDQLDTLLGDVDVGVVPVLWEDNLPQVAIEMHARHIPLLTSDLGGARELGNCDAMVFPAGSVAGFHDRIAAVLDGRVDFEAYWRNARAPQTMEAHVEELLAIYRGEADAGTAGSDLQRVAG